jgi:hypothetical protein
MNANRDYDQPERIKFIAQHGLVNANALSWE